MVKIAAAQVKELRDRTGVGMMDAKKSLVETEGDMDKAIELLREKGMADAAKKADRIAAEGLSTIAVDGNRAVMIEINSETDYVAKNADFVQLVDEIAEAIVKSDAQTFEEAKEADLNGQTVADAVIGATNKIGENISFRRAEIVEKTDSQNFGPYVHGGGQISALAILEGANEDIARDVAMHISAINPQYTNRDEVPSEQIASEKEILIEQAKNEGKPENIVERMVEGRLNKWLGEISLNDQDFVKNPDVTVGKHVSEANGEVVSFIRYEVGEGIERRVENLAEEIAKELNN